MSSKKTVLFGSSVLAAALASISSPVMVRDGVAGLAEGVTIDSIQSMIASKTLLNIGLDGFRLAATTSGIEITAYNSKAMDGLVKFGAKFAKIADQGSDYSEFKTIGQVRVATITKDDFTKALEVAVGERRIDAGRVVLTKNQFAVFMGSLYRNFADQQLEQKRA